MTLKDILTLVPIRRQIFFFRRYLRKRRWLRDLEKRATIFVAEPEIVGRLDQYEQMISIGDNTNFERDVTFWLAKEADARPLIEIGEKVYIGRNCFLGSYLPLRIGRATLIGAYSYVITAEHRFENRAIDIRDQGYTAKEVTIGSNVWLGCRVVVLPGVVIGDNSIVGAGSVVTKSIPENEIWAGVPARKIRDRP